MTLLLLGVSLCMPFVHASLASSNGTITPALDLSSSSSCYNTRTLWTIIWTCAATLSACAWTAIHPNINGVKETRVAFTIRRLFVTVMTLIAPELIITWAARQLFSAREARNDFNNAIRAHHAKTQDENKAEEGTATKLTEKPHSDEWHSTAHAKGIEFTEWTLTHGFFAYMGGFMLYVDKEPVAALTPNELRKFIEEESVDMPFITKEDIEDRSRADVLSKGIALLQLVWFILQLIARLVQRLPITLLEIDTLAVVILTCVAYGLWWKKPKDVGHPYPVHWKSTSTKPLPKLYYATPDPRLKTSRFRHVIYIFHSLLSLVDRPSIPSDSARSCRVPTLGGYGEDDGDITLQSGIFSGVIFGAIHCLGWNSMVPGTLTLICRVASIALIASPVFIFAPYNRILGPNARYLRLFIVLVSSVAYVAGRIIIIVLILMSLTSLPHGAYDIVSWTIFFPHF